MEYSLEKRQERKPRRIPKKTWTRFFDAIVTGEKTFDIRLNNFKVDVGDLIIFKEYDDAEGKLTGRRVIKRVSYIVNTRPITERFWKKDQIEKYGFKILGLEEPYPRCPNWQCGGRLHTQDANYSKEDDPNENLSWQVPEMVCDNCHSVFRCVRFGKGKPIEVI